MLVIRMLLLRFMISSRAKWTISAVVEACHLLRTECFATSADRIIQYGGQQPTLTKMPSQTSCSFSYQHRASEEDLVKGISTMPTRSVIFCDFKSRFAHIVPCRFGTGVSMNTLGIGNPKPDKFYDSEQHGNEKRSRALQRRFGTRDLPKQWTDYLDI